MDEAREEGAEVFQVSEGVPEGCFYPPTVITNVNTASRVVMEEIFGPGKKRQIDDSALQFTKPIFIPVLVALPFRTAKEAISIANNTLYGLAGSVHSEQVI